MFVLVLMTLWVDLINQFGLGMFGIRLHKYKLKRTIS